VVLIPVPARYHLRPVQVGLPATVSAAALHAGGEDADLDEPRVCRTEDCDDRADDGEGWNGHRGNCGDRIYAAEHGSRGRDPGEGGQAGH
jgi:hypothetical protein